MAQNWTDDTYGPTHTAESDLLNIESNFAAIKSAFSGSSAPTGPVAGQFWYKTDTDELKVYDGTQWRKIINTSTNKVANAESVDGFSASATPTPNTLIALNASGEIPPGVVVNTLSTEEITTPISGSWTCPDNVTTVFVTVQGAGGGGGGGGGGGIHYYGGGGGGGGATVSGYMVVVSPGSTYTYTLGSGGTGGVDRYHDGGNGGGTSIFGVTAPGGMGGERQAWTDNWTKWGEYVNSPSLVCAPGGQANGATSGAYGGSALSSGGEGRYGVNGGSSARYSGGTGRYQYDSGGEDDPASWAGTASGGGASMMGAGGDSGVPGSVHGSDGGPGAGGGGAYNGAGGDGGDGVIQIQYFI